MTLLDAITPGILRRLLRQQLYLALLLVVAVWFIFSVRDVLPIFLFSFILAYLLGPLVRRVAGPEGKGLSRGTAALVVYLLVIALLAVLLYVGYQALRDEVGAYIRSFPAYRLQLLDNLRQQEHNGLLRGLPQSAKDSVNNFVLNFNAVVSDTARRTLPGLVRSVPHLIELIAVPIVAYYLLVDYRRFIDYVGHAMAPTGRGRFDALVADLNNSLRGYLAGQLTLSLIAGAAAFLILAPDHCHRAGAARPPGRHAHPGAAHPGRPPAAAPGRGHLRLAGRQRAAGHPGRAAGRAGSGDGQHRADLPHHRGGALDGRRDRGRRHPVAVYHARRSYTERCGHPCHARWANRDPHRYADTVRSSSGFDDAHDWAAAGVGSRRSGRTSLTSRAATMARRCERGC